MDVWRVEVWVGGKQVREVGVPAGACYVGRYPQRCRIAFPPDLYEVSERAAELVVDLSGMVTVKPTGRQSLTVTDTAGRRLPVPDGGCTLSDIASLTFFNGGLNVAELVFRRAVRDSRRPAPSTPSGTTRDLTVRQIPAYTDARGQVTWELVGIVAAALHRRHQAHRAGRHAPGAAEPVALSSAALLDALIALTGQPLTARVLTDKLSAGNDFFQLGTLGTDRRRDGKAVPLAAHILETRWAEDQVLDEVERRIAMARAQ